MHMCLHTHARGSEFDNRCLTYSVGAVLLKDAMGDALLRSCIPLPVTVVLRPHMRQESIMNAPCVSHHVAYEVGGRVEVSGTPCVEWST